MALLDTDDGVEDRVVGHWVVNESGVPKIEKIGFFIYKCSYMYIYGIVEIEVVNPNHKELRKVRKRRLANLI